MKKKFFLGLFLVIFLGAVSWPFFKAGKRRIENEENSLKAWDFTLSDISGQTISLKNFQDKVILLTFWASRCPFCIREIPILKRIYEKYKNKDVEVVSIAVGEDKESMERIKIREDIPYFILLDEKMEVSYFYKVIGVPTDIIIDRKGNIRYYNFYWPNNLEEIIEELLKD